MSDLKPLCCEKRYYGLCPDHGMDSDAHASLVENSIKLMNLERGMGKLIENAWRDAAQFTLERFGTWKGENVGVAIENVIANLHARKRLLDSQVKPYKEKQ